MTPDEVRKLLTDLSADLKYPGAEYRERAVVKILAWLVERELAREEAKPNRYHPGCKCNMNLWCYEFGTDFVTTTCKCGSASRVPR